MSCSFVPLDLEKGVVCLCYVVILKCRMDAVMSKWPFVDICAGCSLFWCMLHASGDIIKSLCCYIYTDHLNFHIKRVLFLKCM